MADDSSLERERERERNLIMGEMTNQDKLRPRIKNRKETCQVIQVFSAQNSHAFFFFFLKRELL